MLSADRKRAELAENVTKLRDALKHWQTWEAEYEGLKEELTDLEPTLEASSLVSSGYRKRHPELRNIA